MNKKEVVRFLSHRFPKYFGNKIYHTILRPQIQKWRSHELATLAKATASFQTILGYKIQMYKWGSGSQSILLIHGWEGHAGNFSDIIEELLQLDYTIYSYDAPGHGNSSGGDLVMFDFQEVARVIIGQLGVKKIISHSFGSVATTYSLAKMPDYEVEKCVMMTTPSSFASNVYNQCYRLGLSRRAVIDFFDRIKKEYQVNVNDLNVAKFVRIVNVKKALILHDVADRVIPFKDSKSVADNWKVAQLEAVKHTGHFRILRTPSVTQKVINFLNDELNPTK